MKSQLHNKGELKELKVVIEKDIVDTLERMSANTGITLDELVVIALKRFRASHGDYDGTTPKAE
ncbi:MAG: hypothetical protein COW01_05660 [Bdellovibrionales bacterium CG12_big_fil_rev_8_21_14_0_65_38_15]|nr:MAG: hypothetical protein COW79_03555 [Bdellovibrionales bacterium CG22_combo_CG10-13_8_21_14_all_38_13]PIQ55918.1 MAG: hypothetical protein COW01_05660 [Bdellovibrionales bacterium CG12_big_fil_rev_8_21_14_0_65_38_15]PIR29631.1 MAG: hypothetical protein COV38_09360 [Bdellovibrionales bacterium CG11_big_fil_rev_8_21_14_0_20_38_13]